MFANDYYYDYENDCYLHCMVDYDTNYEYYNKHSAAILSTFSKTSFDLDFFKRKKGFSVLSQKDREEILKTFLNGLNSHAYKLFCEMYKDERIFFTDYLVENIDGKCFNINRLGKSYIAVEGTKTTLPKLALLMHEFGHAYEFDLLKDKNFEQRNGIYKTNLHEVCSFFFEKSFLEFLKENHINDIENYFIRDRLYKYLFNHALAQYYVTHSINEEIIDYDFILTSEENKRLSDEVYKKYGYDIFMEDVESIDINEALVYTTGLVTALDLVEYHKDRGPEFIKDFDDILMMYGLSLDNSIYEKMGIKDNNLLKANTLKKLLVDHQQEGVSLKLK
jgi:hypothetical protein